MGPTGPAVRKTRIFLVDFISLFSILTRVLPKIRLPATQELSALYVTSNGFAIQYWATDRPEST